MKQKSLWVKWVWATLLLVGSCSAFSQAAYPNKPIKIVVPYPAGGNADITGRVLAKKMSDILNVAVVVENRGGANGGIGTDAVVKAAPDGYTLLLGTIGPLAINPTLYGNLPFDPLKDLTPVSLIGEVPNVLAVPVDRPYRSVAEIIAAAKATKAANQPVRIERHCIADICRTQLLHMRASPGQSDIQSTGPTQRLKESSTKRIR